MFNWLRNIFKTQEWEFDDNGKMIRSRAYRTFDYRQTTVECGDHYSISDYEQIPDSLKKVLLIKIDNVVTVIDAHNYRQLFEYAQHLMQLNRLYLDQYQELKAAYEELKDKYEPEQSQPTKEQ